MLEPVAPEYKVMPLSVPRNEPLLTMFAGEYSWMPLLLVIVPLLVILASGEVLLKYSDIPPVVLVKIEPLLIKLVTLTPLTETAGEEVLPEQPTVTPELTVKSPPVALTVAYALEDITC